MIMLKMWLLHSYDLSLASYLVYCRQTFIVVPVCANHTLKFKQIRDYKLEIHLTTDLKINPTHCSFGEHNDE